MFGERGDGTALDRRRDREIDADADNHAVLDAFEQDARKLGACEHEVVGPLETQVRLRGDMRQDRFVNREAGDQRQAGRRRIAGGEPDHRRAHEVAASIHPGAPLPALAAGLAIGDQPVAFGHALAAAQPCGEFVIGRNAFGDELDHTAMNSTEAALPANPSSQGVSR